jgi:homoserine O-acetyltransferase
MKKNEKFNLGNIKLLSGKILKSAQLVYKTYGKLNKDRSNVIILPTFYTGSHTRNEGFIGKNRAINPNKYFIVSINMFGNGLSSSPTNTIKSQSGSKFPTITLWDNIYCQHKLITEKLKIKKIALVTGWSMAGCQSYQWAAQYPSMVKAILPFCASSKTSIHNHVFLEGVKAALTADKKWNNGNYKKQPIENRFISRSILRPIDSPYGHCAANPGNDKNFETELDKNINKLLQN